MSFVSWWFYPQMEDISASGCSVCDYVMLCGLTCQQQNNSKIATNAEGISV